MFFDSNFIVLIMQIRTILNIIILMSFSLAFIKVIKLTICHQVIMSTLVLVIVAHNFICHWMLHCGGQFLCYFFLYIYKSMQKVDKSIENSDINPHLSVNDSISNFFFNVTLQIDA